MNYEINTLKKKQEEKNNNEIKKIRLYFKKWIVFLENKDGNLDFDKYKSKNIKYINNLNELSLNKDLKEEIMKVLMNQKIFLINKEKEQRNANIEDKIEVKNKVVKDSKGQLTDLIKINNNEIESCEFKCIIQLNNIFWRLNEIMSYSEKFVLGKTFSYSFKKTKKEILLFLKFLNIEKINKVLNGLLYENENENQKDFQIVLNFCKVNKEIISKYNNYLEKIYKILTKKIDVVILNEPKLKHSLKIENNQIILNNQGANIEKIVFFDNLKKTSIDNFFKNLSGVDSVIINCNNTGVDLEKNLELQNSFNFGYDKSNFDLQIPQLSLTFEESKNEKNGNIKKVGSLEIWKYLENEVVVINIPKFTNPINVLNKYFKNLKLKDVIYADKNEILTKYIKENKELVLLEIITELEESFVINEFINIIKYSIPTQSPVNTNTNFDLDKYSFDNFFENPKKNKLYKALKLLNIQEKYLNIVMNFTNDFDDNLFLLNFAGYE